MPSSAATTGRASLKHWMAQMGFVEQEAQAFIETLDRPPTAEGIETILYVARRAREMRGEPRPDLRAVKKFVLGWIREWFGSDVRSNYAIARIALYLLEQLALERVAAQQRMMEVTHVSESQ